MDFPAHGQTRTSNELRKLGTFVSPSGVRSIWLRHNLACFRDRMKALEAKVASEGIILTEVQVAALERKKHDDVASGEIETAHPGYLGSQDTFYVGTFKGVTFIDTYAKLYTTKTPITAADMLNDKVLPFFEQNSLPLLRILTDRGTEYCGRADQHDYQLYLALNDIEHTKTKVKSPQTNGICERFHKTILQEFYQVTLRKKIDSDLESLQADLDEWLVYYNTERTMNGKRALMGSFTSSALFYLVAKFVCVCITHRTPALNLRTLAHKPQTSARACICLSLFFLGAIKDGVPASVVKDELERVAKRQDDLATLMESQDEEPRPLIHPTMSRRYRNEIAALTSALTNGGATEAREQVRGLIEKIVLTPKDGKDELSLDLHGDLAGILRIASEDKSMKVKGNIEKRLEAIAINDNDPGAYHWKSVW